MYICVCRDLNVGRQVFGVFSNIKKVPDANSSARVTISSRRRRLQSRTEAGWYGKWFHEMQERQRDEKGARIAAFDFNPFCWIVLSLVRHFIPSLHMLRHLALQHKKNDDSNPSSPLIWSLDDLSQTSSRLFPFLLIEQKCVTRFWLRCKMLLFSFFFFPVCSLCLSFHVPDLSRLKYVSDVFCPTFPSIQKWQVNSVAIELAGLAPTVNDSFLQIAPVPPCLSLLRARYWVENV